MGGIFVGPGVLVHADLGFAEGLPQLAARVESAPRRPGFGTRGLTGDRVERLGWFAAERQPGERFGDFAWRVGLVGPSGVEQGAA
mgnify:CR=1 FL=1